MDQGKVGLMDFTALLHFAEKGGVVLATCHEKKATGFAVEPADKGKKFLRVVVAEPIDEGEGSVGSSGVNEPTCRFIHDEEGGVVEKDGGFHDWNYEERCTTSRGSELGLR